MRDPRDSLGGSRSLRMERRRFLGAVGSGLATGLAGALSASRVAAQDRGRPGEGDAPRVLTREASGLDRTHLPILSLPARTRLGRSFDLVVRIGEPLHEQRRDHHVQWVEVRYGADRLFVCELSPDVPFPVVRIPVILRRSDELAVRTRCSQHGSFEWRLALTPG